MSGCHQRSIISAIRKTIKERFTPPPLSLSLSNFTKLVALPEMHLQLLVHVHSLEGTSVQQQRLFRKFKNPNFRQELNRE